MGICARSYISLDKHGNKGGSVCPISDLVIGVPDTVTEIADDAFDTSVTLYCGINGAAEAYCKARGMEYIVK